MEAIYLHEHIDRVPRTYFCHIFQELQSRIFFDRNSKIISKFWIKASFDFLILVYSGQSPFVNFPCPVFRRAKSLGGMRE